MDVPSFRTGDSTPKTWTETIARICQRWPSWSPSEVELEDWANALSPLDQPMLADALYRVGCSYSSLTPQLKWVLTQYDVVARERRQAGRDVRQHDEALPPDYAMRERLAELDDERRDWIKRYAFTQWPGMLFANASNDPRDWDEGALARVYWCAKKIGCLWTEREAVEA